MQHLFWNGFVKSFYSDIETKVLVYKIKIFVKISEILPTNTFNGIFYSLSGM